jgi:hypothetical protein
MNIYDVGDSVRVRGIFTVTGTATDPSVVILQVRDPDGNIDPFSLVGELPSNLMGTSTEIYSLTNLVSGGMSFSALGLCWLQVKIILKYEGR